jgi:hypothetical protein
MERFKYGVANGRRLTDDPNVLCWLQDLWFTQKYLKKACAYRCRQSSPYGLA